MLLLILPVGQRLEDQTASASAGCAELLARGTWLQGRGVEVNKVGGTCPFEEYQCVNLAYRQYIALGWGNVGGLGSNGGAKDMWTILPGRGFERQAQGSITRIIPGDLIIHGAGVGYGYGHVAVIDTISGSTINAVEQNGSSTGRATYTWSGGSLSRSGLGDILGIIHAPANGGPPASSLSNGGFEDGALSPWIVTHNPGGTVNRAVYNNASRAHSGNWFMEANTSVAGASVGQDTYIVPEQGKYYSLRVWVRDPSGLASPVSVTVALWALDGQQENATTTATIGSGWTPVDVVLRPLYTGHTRLRVEFYMNTPGRNINFDDAAISISSSDPGVNTSNPFGWLDSAASLAPGKVAVRGWSIDPSYPTAPVDVHVYIGGQAGQAGAIGYNLGTANLSRTDVAGVYPYAGPAHGFEQTVTTTITGSTQICAYGINRGQGSNAMLSGSCKTITILSGPTTASAPTISTVKPSSGTLTVSFAPPSNTGGTAITNYQYSTNGGTTWVSRSPAAVTSPLIISALTNGTAYNVKIRALNSVGAGAASNTVAATACTVPGAPSLVALKAGNSGISASFTQPSVSGGCAVINYLYSTDNGATWSLRSPASIASPLAIGGLTNGVAYTVRLRAVNAAGAGPASASLKATPAPTVPSAPTITTITPVGNGLTVSFAGPATNGGATITNYQYSVNGGTSWMTRSPMSVSSPLTISGLLNGTAYTVQIRAVNAVGAGAASNSAVGTPAATPSAPNILSITAGFQSLTVAFSAPASDGGASITNYQYSTNGGTTWIARSPASITSPMVIYGLTSGGSYSVALRAINSSGAGASSIAVAGTPLYSKTLTVNGCNTYGMHCDNNPVFSAVPVVGAPNPPIATALNHGTQFTAFCWSEGVTTYNYATWDPGPNPYDSNIYYYSRTSGGVYGWVPDTWSARDKWNRAGLPRC